MIDPLPNSHRSVLSVPLLVVGVHFAAFALARLALLLLYPADFSALAPGEIAWSFVRGMRFDGSIIFVVIGIPVFMLLIPVSAARARAWQAVWGWISFACLIAFSFVLAADDVYFGFVGRHVGVELSAPEESLEAVARTGAVEFLLPILVFLAVAAVAAFAWQRMLRRSPLPTSNRIGQGALSLACLGLMYLGSMGTLGGSRVRIVHAFDGVSHEAAGYLALNGPFSIAHSLEKLKSVKIAFYPWAEALKTTQDVLFTPGEVATRADYPLLRGRPAQAQRGAKPNVVVIMLESWDARIIDAHRRADAREPLGLTPNYDALARQGVLFSHFYASGQRSMDGMSALIAGIPTLPKMPFLGRGVEQNGLPFLGQLAQQEGYQTYFIQSAHHWSFRSDAIASLAGFTTYMGAEDVPAIQPAVSRSPLDGEAWDHEMFAEANRRLSEAKQPFLAFLYTATTHTPYEWPSDEWQKLPPDSLEHRYRNSIAYADWALGQYFAGAREAGYFDSTIFIITADHVGGPRPPAKGDLAEFHHVPGLIVAPGLTPGVDSSVASQLDVIPTIAALAGWEAPESALGRSLVPASPGGGALCIEGDLLVRIEPGGFLLHDLNARLRTGSYADGTDFDAMEKRLLSIYQVAATLVRQNRLYPPLTDRRLASQ